MPKVGFTNIRYNTINIMVRNKRSFHINIMYRSLCSFSKKDMQILNLCKVQEFIDKGRLVPKSDSFITIRDFLSSGLISRAKDGVKLLAQVRLVCMVRI